ncbi:MAG TPA: hypothetical protein V6C97_19045 [Oculatellaceae cyanobacterium]
MIAITVFVMLTLIQSLNAQICIAQTSTKTTPLLRSQSAKMDTQIPRTSEPAKSHLLFGRVEQLTTQEGAQFPLTEEKPIGGTQASNDGTLYTGKLVNEFPAAFHGGWRGTLRLMQCDLAPAAQSKPQSSLCRVGMVGQTNVKFEKVGGRLRLSPLNIAFQVPLTDERYSALAKSTSPAPSAHDKQTNRTDREKPFTFVISLGDIQGPTFAGGELKAHALSNGVREVGPSTFEQDLLVEQFFQAPYQPPENGYCENVIRFRRLSATKVFVQAVTVTYDQQRQFLSKMSFAGYIQKFR